jgi:hypothetical protein
VVKSNSIDKGQSKSKDADGRSSSPAVSPRTQEEGPKSPSSFLPAKGERALSIGQTGSGKTTFNRWLLERLPDAPIIIYDTKHDPKFDQLPGNRVAHTIDDVESALDDLSVDYVILRPPPIVTASPATLDRILMYHEEHWRNVDAYIDELYHFHKSNYAGPGLNGLYTRGRARGITTIGSTQRPAWVSGFIFSETQLFYVFDLARLSDRKKVGDFIEGYEDLKRPGKHEYYVYRQGEQLAPKLMKAIPIADAEKLGYTDVDKSHGTDAAESEPVEESPKPRGANFWL